MEMDMVGSRRIESQAAAWLARQDGDAWSERDQAGLDAWLAEATAHRVAFLRLQAAWAQSGRLKALGAGGHMDAVPARGQWSRSPFGQRESRPSTLAATPPVAVPDVSHLVFAPRPPQRAARWPRYASAAMAALLMVSLGLGWRHYATLEEAAYRTAVGDLRTVPLSDGSHATLSSDSHIQVSLSRAERHIDLQQGEAFFEAAKDPGRPFVVSAGGRRVIAVGTRFAVRRAGPDLRVVVTEGTVRLESDTGADRHRQPVTLLPAGSVALVSRQGVLVRTGSVEDAERYVDWRSGYLAFHDTSLATAAEEFNRYNARKIVIGDAEVGSLRVGGNFRWSNAEVFVRLLEQGFPVRAEREPDRIVLHSR